jgi:hypothetical protein
MASYLSNLRAEAEILLEASPADSDLRLTWHYASELFRQLSLGFRGRTCSDVYCRVAPIGSPLKFERDVAEHNE